MSKSTAKGRPPGETPGVTLPMNAWGWLAPGIMVALLLLAVGLILYPNKPAAAIIPAVLVGVVLTIVGKRRSPAASLRVDDVGLHALWRDQMLDVPWQYVTRVKRASVWFEAAAVTDQPTAKIPTAVKKAIIRGRLPRVNFVSFTWSLQAGPAAEVVRRNRPDLLGAPTGEVAGTGGSGLTEPDTD